MFMKTIVIILFVSLNINAVCQQTTSWQIWVIPNKYTINLGDRLDLMFGITGCGSLKHLKIVSYSEETTMIQYGNENGQYFSYYRVVKSPEKLFTKKINDGIDTIALLTDLIPPFEKLHLTPKTSGDKKLLMIATYSPDGKNWYTTSRELFYHVNSFVERFQTPLTLFTIFLALIAGINLKSILTGIKDLWCYLRKRSIQIFKNP